MTDLERCQEEIQRHITTIEGNKKVLKLFQDEIHRQIQTIETMNGQLNQQTEMLLIEATKRQELNEENTRLRKGFVADTSDYCIDLRKTHKKLEEGYEQKLEECQKKLEECQPTEEGKNAEQHWSQQLSKQKRHYEREHIDTQKTIEELKKKNKTEKQKLLACVEDNLSLRNLVKAIRGKIMGAIRSGKNQVVRMVLEDDDEEWNGLMAEASQFGGRKRRRKTKRKRMRKRRRKTRKR